MTTENEDKQIDDGGAAKGDLNRIDTLERQLAETISLLKSLTGAVFNLQQRVVEQMSLIKTITFEINDMLAERRRREGGESDGT